MLSFVEWAELDEVLTAQQRKKRGIQMKRNRAKLRRGRKRARQRVAGTGVLQRRAKRQARRDVFRKLTRGKNPSDVNPAFRRAIELRVKKKQGLIGRKTKQLVRVKKREDVARRR